MTVGETAVEDRHAVGVARQTSQHGLRPDKWPLGIDHYSCWRNRHEQVGEDLGVVQRHVCAQELQPVREVKLLKSLDDEPARFSSKDFVSIESPNDCFG